MIASYHATSGSHRAIAITAVLKVARRRGTLLGGKGVLGQLLPLFARGLLVVLVIIVVVAV